MAAPYDIDFMRPAFSAVLAVDAVRMLPNGSLVTSPALAAAPRTH